MRERVRVCVSRTVSESVWGLFLKTSDIKILRHGNLPLKAKPMFFLFFFFASVYSLISVVLFIFGLGYNGTKYKQANFDKTK